VNRCSFGVLALTSSPLFRDARDFEIKANSKIKYSVTLIDPEFETAAIFEKILSMIIQGSVELPGIDVDKSLNGTARLCGQLCRFISKWDSQVASNILQRSLFGFVAGANAGAILAFVFGAALNNPDLCRAALLHWNTCNNWHPHTTRLFSPSFWPTWAWENCPASHTAAVVLTWMEYGGSNKVTVSQATESVFRHVKEFEAKAMSESWCAGEEFGGKGR
jgi:hypothetical protein